MSGGSNGGGPDTIGPPPVRIEYPTYYTFKATGLTGGVRARMLELIERVLGAPVDAAQVTARSSSGGKYESISAHVYLRSEDERRLIYEAFHAALTIEKVFVWYV